MDREQNWTGKWALAFRRLFGREGQVESKREPVPENGAGGGMPQGGKEAGGRVWRGNGGGLEERHVAKAILLGTAVGDALGFPVQFIPRKEVQKSPVTGMHPWHSRWSDDTSLSLCLADSLCEGYDLWDIGNKFVYWMKEGLWTPKGAAFDIGMTTNRAIENLADGVSPEVAGMDRERDNGNGSLMRISPLVPAILGLGREEQLRRISEVSSLTHRHPRSVLACIFLCDFELACLEGKGMAEAFAHAQEGARQLLTTEKFKDEAAPFARLTGCTYEQFRGLPEDDVWSGGYVMETLEASLWCLFNHDNFRDTVLHAVNLGYDADTTGAVAGAAAGIVYGWQAIPEEWVNALARKEDIIALADRLDGVLAQAAGA